MADKERKNRTQNGIQSFFRETTGELRKVTWPTRPEAMRLTLLVLIVMFIMMVLLGAVDYLALQGLNLLLGFS